MAGRAGVIDLRDLSSRYAWRELAIHKVMAAAQLEARGRARHRFVPPEVVVAVVPFEDMELVERSRAWLSDARAVLIARVHDVFPFEDPELREYVEELWRELAAGFAVPLELHDWRRDAELSAILVRAAQLAEHADALAEPARPAPPMTLARGPRFELLPRQYAGELDLVRSLAAGLRSTSAGAVLETEGATLLLSEQREPVQQDRFGYYCGVLSDGRRIEGKRQREQSHNWLLGEQPFTAYGHLALGADPHHPVGWTGHRMFAFWLYRGTTGIGFFSATDHDHPCGPSKKLYGYADNDPVRVELDPLASMIAFTFEHDVLLTSALPIPWRSAGTLDVADFARDAGRTVLFVHDAESPFSRDLLDDDARSRPPIVVLGPSAEARYAVDLSGLTYRIAASEPNQGTVVLVGGPEPVFAVFDAAHRLSRKASGRLLGGAHGSAFLVDQGAYFREDLGSGQRVLVGPAEDHALCAVPVPGTTNVVLLTQKDSRFFAQLL